MRGVGHARTVTRDFSGGMYRSLAPELIPDSGCFDITNGLLDEDGAVYKRGGSSFLPGVLNDSGEVTVAWSGFLTGGFKTVMVTPTAANVVTDAGVTNLTGGGVAGFGRAAAFDGTLYLPGGLTYSGSGGALGTAPEVGDFYSTVKSRLIVATGDVVKFSEINSTMFALTDFHQLDGGVQILGIEGLRDSLAVFTTDGVWLIRNMQLNLTDSDGNVQHSLDRYSTDLILWGDAGIAGWSGALVVPGRDAVWMMSLGVASEAGAPFVPISGKIEDLYRSYVDRGAEPGCATVFRAHYLLPIVLDGQVIDTLVCRLDARDRRGNLTYPWTHFTGTPPAFVSVQGGAPKLWGGGGGRASQCGYFSPSGVTPRDAGAAGPLSWSVTTRDFATGPMNDNTVVKVRVTYQLVQAASSPAIQAFYGSDRLTGSRWGEFEWGSDSWTSPDGVFDQLVDPVADAPEDVAAAAPFSWRVRRKARYARFRFVCADDVSRLSLRAFELFVRESGRI